MPNLVFQEALVGEVQLHLAIGEDDEGGRRNRGLGHVINLYLLPGGDRGALEVHAFEEAVHLPGTDAFTALARHFFQGREYLLRTLAGRSRDEEDGRVTEKLQRVAQPLFVGGAVAGAP